MGCSHRSRCSVHRSCIKVVVVAEDLPWGVSHPSRHSVQRSWAEVLAVAEGLSWGVATLPRVLCRDLVLRWSLLQTACHGMWPWFPVFCAEILC